DLDRAGTGQAPRQLSKRVADAHREAQSFLLRLETRRVADRRHLDRRLRAVDEAVEHLRVGRGRTQAVTLPDGVRRRQVEAGLVAGSLARAHDVEPAGP